jgi:hypothetical protein
MSTCVPTHTCNPSYHYCCFGGTYLLLPWGEVFSPPREPTREGLTPVHTPKTTRGREHHVGYAGSQDTETLCAITNSKGSHVCRSTMPDRFHQRQLADELERDRYALMQCHRHRALPDIICVTRATGQPQPSPHP